MASITTKVGDLPNSRRVYLPFLAHRTHRHVMAYGAAWFAVRDTLLDSAVAAHCPMTLHDALEQAGRIVRLLEADGVIQNVAQGRESAQEAAARVRWSRFGHLAMVRSDAALRELEEQAQEIDEMEVV